MAHLQGAGRCRNGACKNQIQEWEMRIEKWCAEQDLVSMISMKQSEVCYDVSAARDPGSEQCYCSAVSAHVRAGDQLVG